jgi:hypothetical protein
VCGFTRGLQACEQISFRAKIGAAFVFNAVTNLPVRILIADDFHRDSLKQGTGFDKRDSDLSMP